MLVLLERILVSREERKKGERENEEVRSMARVLQVRVEPELAVPGRFRSHRRYHHQILSRPNCYSL